MGGCFQRVWLEPVLLSILPFTSEKNLLAEFDLAGRLVSVFYSAARKPQAPGKAELTESSYSQAKGSKLGLGALTLAWKVLVKVPIV